MTAATPGLVGVSIIAGHITATDQPVHPVIGQQFVMGNGTEFILHITPEVRDQWIAELAKSKDNA